MHLFGLELIILLSIKQAINWFSVITTLMDINWQVFNFRGKNRNKEINDIQLATDHLAENLAAQEKGIPDFSNSGFRSLPNKKILKAWAFI